MRGATRPLPAHAARVSTERAVEVKGGTAARLGQGVVARPCSLAAPHRRREDAIAVNVQECRADSHKARC
eukprot:scaffold10474_cov122-Isochrysis_galbana.AAC.2